MFKQNEGNIERIGRLTLGIVIMGAALTILSGGVFQWVGVVVGVVFMVTGATGICPLYSIIGMITKQGKDICPTCTEEESAARR